MDMPMMAHSRPATMEDIVAGAEATLVDTQVTVETLRVAIANFTRMHHAQVGALYLRLDDLEALIAETVAALSGDPEDIRKAYEARSRVTELPEIDPEPRTAVFEPTGPGATPASGGGEGGDDGDRVRPARTAQRLYRELARRAHPDLVQDPDEKRRREEFITRVNDAYRRGDLSGLQRLSEEWTVIATPAPETGSPQRDPWLRGRLIWLRARIAELQVERETLLGGPMGGLLNEYDFDPASALVAISDRLRDQIAEREAHLQELLGG
jgi:hypothetical protein